MKIVSSKEILKNKLFTVSTKSRATQRIRDSSPHHPSPRLGRDASRRRAANYVPCKQSGFRRTGIGSFPLAASMRANPRSIAAKRELREETGYTAAN